MGKKKKKSKLNQFQMLHLKLLILLYLMNKVLQNQKRSLKKK